jgi:hypothetical protein
MTIVTVPDNAVYDQPPLLVRESCGDGVLHISVLSGRVMDELAARQDELARRRDERA